MPGPLPLLEALALCLRIGARVARRRLNWPDKCLVYAEADLENLQSYALTFLEQSIHPRFGV